MRLAASARGGAGWPSAVVEEAGTGVVVGAATRGWKSGGRVKARLEPGRRAGAAEEAVGFEG